MKNKQDYCEIDRVEINPTPKPSKWTKSTTMIKNIASFAGSIKVIVEFINYILHL
ncbi:hypothetical protein FLACHUCJ7_03498 [Flavobacterium chungangense]|uniref:Uncharacterized protein n=1 Tax=Flavobacterium chungangense TaxID=554283 RepID=A0A6V6Z7V1_9FLAO|nr:hypothetical protein FLACHUCJ7_03498 [Flavobacterium chungangense]